MRRRQLQHIILEVGERFALTEVFVIGSSAILAVLPDPPEGVLTTTRDVDIIPPNDGDERIADQISYVIGESSPFDIEHGYHAQGVSMKTPTYAPHGWQARTIDVSVGKIVAHCEIAYIERMKLAIGIDDWPDQDIGLVAVTVADGKPTILRRECGATIAGAVAASCCLPGLSPPVSISGRHYMDGGMRSTANADLASGFDSILVLCFHPPRQPGERVLTRVAAQSEALVKSGACVSVISPDEASLAAIGPRTMDVVRRPGVARAALAQGAAAVDAVSRFWEETRQPAR
jgi:hypothetical protein